MKIPNNLDFFDIEIKKNHHHHHNHSPRSLLLPSPPPIISDLNTFPSLIDSLMIENNHNPPIINDNDNNGSQK